MTKARQPKIVDPVTQAHFDRWEAIARMRVKAALGQPYDFDEEHERVLENRIDRTAVVSKFMAMAPMTLLELSVYVEGGLVYPRPLKKVFQDIHWLHRCFDFVEPEPLKNGVDAADVGCIWVWVVPILSDDKKTALGHRFVFKPEYNAIRMNAFVKPPAELAVGDLHQEVVSVPQ